MHRLLGYSLIGVGLFGFFFFLKYKGTTIPLKELWFVLSVITVIVGSYFLGKYKFQKLDNKPNFRDSNRLAEIDRLKSVGERVRVTLDNAEVKSKSFRQEIINDGFPSRREMLDGLYDSNRNYKTQEIAQTYVVFYKKYSGKEYKFISQATTRNVEDVKMYIYRLKGINLYIDPKNPTKYYFDLNFE